MRKVKTIILFFFSVSCLLSYPQSNISQIEYFFNTDPGFGNAIQVNPLPDTIIDTTLNIDISALLPGVNFLYIRAKSDSGWSITHSKPLLVISSAPASKIKQLEYFIDFDNGYGNNTLIDYTSFDSTFIENNFTIPLNSISRGFHILYYRCQDMNGKWGQTFAKPLMVKALENAPSINRIEYYFDFDPGYGNGIPFAFTNDSVISGSFNYDLSGLPPGFHIIYTRAMDSNGVWSQTINKPILVISNNTFPDISGLEYYFDSDPGYGKGITLSITPGENVNEMYSIPLNGIANGFHIMYLRAIDSENNWSFTYSKPFIKYGNVDNPQIIEIEYALDTDPGIGNALKIALNANEITDTTITISIDTMAEGSEHILFVRAKDENGNWSITNTLSFIYNELIEQNINLLAGWNIISFYIEPLDTSIIKIVQPLIDDSLFIKMIDEQGKAIEMVGDSIINTINIVLNTEGYQIKVKKDTFLVVNGIKIPLPYTIPLIKGWNIIGYPSNEPRPAYPSFDYLIAEGYLEKAQDERGNAYEYVEPIGWVEEITNFDPGEGYKIKVNNPAYITFDSINGKKSITITDKNNNLRGIQFKTSWKGNGYNHMNIYITNIQIEGYILKQGDEVAVYDGDNCVGVTEIQDITKQYISVPVSGDDPITRNIEGFEPGNPIAIKIFDSNDGTVITNINPVYYKNCPDKFDYQSTTVLNLTGSKTPENTIINRYNTRLGKNYPNPFTNKTTIEFELGESSDVEIIIFDIMGKKVKNMQFNNLKSGYYTFIWDRTDESNNIVQPGTYLYQFKCNGYTKTRTMIAK